MIFTDRTITVRKGESRIDEPIVVYRGDYELEVRFTILNSRFKFMSGTNMIESEKASYGQLAILTPYGGNIFSDIVRCSDGSVTFVLTAEMLNRIEEVGLYSFQIRLMDYNKESRVSIPPIEFGIEVREPIASEDHDNSVNNAIVGYSIAKVVDPKKENVGDTFDEDGNYNKTKWETGDRISEGKLNKIEDAIDVINQRERRDINTLDKIINNNYNILDSIKAEKTELDVVKSRLDNMMRLEDGSTTGDAELIDARVDINGIIHTSLGDAIRTQTQRLSDRLEDVFNDDNILNTCEYFPNAFHRYGHETEDSSYGYFIVPVKANVSYIASPKVRMVDFYDVSNNFIEFDESMSSKTNPIITPTRSGFMYVTIRKDSLNLIKLATADKSIDNILPYAQVGLSNNMTMSVHPEFLSLEEKIEDTLSIFTSDNLLYNAEHVDNSYFQGDGDIVESDKYHYFKIKLESGKTYMFYPRVRLMSLYYADTNVFYKEIASECNTNKPYTFTPDIDTIAYASFYKNDIGVFVSARYKDFELINDWDSIPTLNADFKLKGNGIVTCNNLLTGAPRADEKYIRDLVDGPVSSDLYCYYRVYLKQGITYYMYPRIRGMVAYDLAGSKSYENFNSVNYHDPFSYTPETDLVAYITYFRNETNKLSIINDPNQVEPLGYKSLDPSIIIPSTVPSSYSNILYKKKWAVIGDSFTAGDFNGYVDQNGLSGTSSPDLYDSDLKMWKTYPWWIMKRNDMTIQNFFAGGRTLATPADGTFKNSITYNDMYKQIDADVDYITIYLGINDGHHMPGSTGDDGEDMSGAIPIGTENDTTINTFYGAWNVLLKDLITLYPFAHIGILVSNGMDTDEHVNATIKMAKKWGIPYLNLDSGYDVPLLIRSRRGCRPETCQEAINIRRQQQQVSPTNGHPNHKTHEYESTFIEDFLRRI